MDASLPLTIDLERVGFDRGGHLLVDRALRTVDPGGAVRVVGEDANLRLHLSVWGRARGHRVDGDILTKGASELERWRGARRAGSPAHPAAVADPRWGLAARGALIEAGGPALVQADLIERDALWTDVAAKLYAQAAASQWDPATAVDWHADDELPSEIEDAVVQLMTFLIENEQAALVVPSRFLGRMHPQFREVVGFLATQIADEARHVEVFTRRALLHRDQLGTSSVGGRASLQSLVDEPDFSLASFLMTVLGEGTFLELLSFLEQFGPDPVTRRVAHLARQDEARHVAFGQAHLEHLVNADPTVRHRLRLAVERRHATLQSTAGLNADVFDALVLLAAGEFTPAAIAAGWDRVQTLTASMHEGRRRRLVRLGFTASEADDLAALHTRNFM